MAMAALLSVKMVDVIGSKKLIPNREIGAIVHVW